MADEIANLTVKIKVKIEVEDETDNCKNKKTREIGSLADPEPLLNTSKT